MSAAKKSRDFSQTEPISILIGALGGEGGGVLTDWLVSAAMAEGYPVQSTSIPGVAQRTGATTYYMEIFPVKHEELEGKQPLMSLYPSPGKVDLAIVTELVEAGRAIENGFVSPDRTTLIASNHRIYAISEKSAMGDGRIDEEHITKAIKTMAKRAIVFDLATTAQTSGSIGNAVLLGAIAACGVLPITPEFFKESIREKGIAVESNLSGFAAGVAQVTPVDSQEKSSATQAQTNSPSQISDKLTQHIQAAFPAETHTLVQEGVARLIDYQGKGYAKQYLKKLKAVLAADQSEKRFKVCNETARHLALWMSYEDVIRVADLKTRADRIAGIRKEAGAKPGEPVQITEFLDPGLEELTAILPPFLAKWLLKRAESRPYWAKFRFPLKVRTDTIWGFFAQWVLARFRRLRPFTYRYQVEKQATSEWLSQIVALMEKDYDLALEWVECARLLKGYGDTYERGHANFQRIFETYLKPTLQGGPLPSAISLQLAREAALADPEGQALQEAFKAG